MIRFFLEESIYWSAQVSHAPQSVTKGLTKNQLSENRKTFPYL